MWFRVTVTERANCDIFSGSKPEVFAMSCRSCGSADSADYTSEILIHFAGLRNINKPGILLFPQVTVCLHCGVAEFTVPEAESRILEQGRARSMAA